MMCSLSPTVDDVCCDLPVTDPVSFHGHITVSATEAFLLPDPECGTLYLKNSDRTQLSDSLGANWNRICLSRLLNHGALWQTVFLHLINILTYLLTYLPPARLSTRRMSHIPAIYLPLLPSHRASPPLGLYSFPILVRVRSCVGPDDMVEIPKWYEQQKNGHPLQY